MADILRTRKASGIFDIILVMVVVFGFIIFTVFGLRFATSFNNQYQNNSMIYNESKVIVQASVDRYVNLFDGAFIFLFVGMVLAAIISAFFMDTHPAFFIVSIILLVVLSFVAAIFGNVFEGFATGELNNEVNQFVYIPFFMSHFLQIMIGVMFLVMIASFAKYKIG